MGKRLKRIWLIFLFCALAVRFLAEAGCSPRRASDFVVRDNKVTKKARLPTAVRRNSLRSCVATLRQPPEVCGTSLVWTSTSTPVLRLAWWGANALRGTDEFYISIAGSAWWVSVWWGFDCFFVALTFLQEEESFAVKNCNELNRFWIFIIRSK